LSIIKRHSDSFTIATVRGHPEVESEIPDIFSQIEECHKAVQMARGTKPEVAKLAYAADSKLDFCSFCPLRNSSQQIDTKKEISLDALKPFAGLFSHF